MSGFLPAQRFVHRYNYAFLLNERAGVTAAENRVEAIADFVTARRVRRGVIERCEAALRAGMCDDKGNIDAAETFWATATLIEGYVGVGDDAKSAELIENSKPPEPWMLESLET
jgi:hypothetical protein